MSGALNFKGVSEAKDSTMTKPGTISVFEIKEVKFDSSKNKGTYYMGVTFARKDDSFQHSFFLTEKALPRVKSLIKAATGTVVEDELLEEQLIKMLTGKKIALKVTAKIDDENGRAYPDLAFGGFAKPEAQVGELVFSDKEDDLNRTAAEIASRGDISKADKAEGAPAAGAPAAGSDDPDFL